MSIPQYIDGDVAQVSDDEIKKALSTLNPEIISYIVQGLIDKKLSATKILTMAIETTTNSFGLAIISIALKLGANPNVYTNVAGLGNVHILGAVAKNKTKYEPKIYVIILALLVTFGAKSNLPMFNQSESLVKDTPVSGISVADWYYNNGYGSELIDITQEGIKNVEIRKDIAALTDKMESDLPLTKVELAIMAQSKGIVSKFIYTHRSSEGDLRPLYDWVFKYYATSLPAELLKARVYPHYYQINHLIIKMKHVSNQGYKTLLLQLASILKVLVAAGVDLDLYQLTLLKSFAPNIAKMIEDTYKTPYWKKACSYQGDNVAGQRLLQLARALQYNGGTSTSEVCTFIKKVSEADQQSLIKAAVDRQKERISVNNSTISEFVASRPTNVCYNATISGEEIYEYSDFDIASYRDSEGHIYCFTRDMFPVLLQEKKNPYTKQALPPSFIESLVKQQDMLNNLGMMGAPETLGSGLRRLSAPDVINNDIDTQYINEFHALGRKHGLTDDYLNNIPQATIQTLLNNMGYNVNVEGLTNEHKHITYVRTFMEDLKRNPVKITPFFEYLRLV